MGSPAWPNDKCLSSMDFLLAKDIFFSHTWKTPGKWKALLAFKWFGRVASLPRSYPDFCHSPHVRK